MSTTTPTTRDGYPVTSKGAERLFTDGSLSMTTIPEFCCRRCGHPCPAEGIHIPADLDVDCRDEGRARCAESACVSDAVCAIVGRVLVTAEVQS